METAWQNQIIKDAVLIATLMASCLYTRNKLTGYGKLAQTQRNANFHINGLHMHMHIHTMPLIKTASTYFLLHVSQTRFQVRFHRF